MKTKKTFRIGRADGRNNAQVVVDFVRNSGMAPGTQFTYEELAAELSKGSPREFERKDVQQVVNKANRRLLNEYQRCLVVVTNVGYSVAPARDHLGIAGGKNKKGQRQFSLACEVLQNVRRDEMTDQERIVHDAQTQINLMLYAEQKRILRKQLEHSRLIAKLTSRITEVEAKVPKRREDA